MTSRITCQRCGGSNRDCPICYGLPSIVELVTLCRKCRRQGWLRGGDLVQSCRAGRKITSFDGVDLVYESGRWVCVTCYGDGNIVEADFKREPDAIDFNDNAT